MNRSTSSPSSYPGVVAGAVSTPGTHPLALAVLLSGTFMVVLDFFIVNVALPFIQSDLHAGSGAIQFVVVGYGLANAATLITGGRLGDIYGRRWMFIIGVLFFTLASAACGLAPSAAVLVTARGRRALPARCCSHRCWRCLAFFTKDLGERRPSSHTD